MSERTLGDLREDIQRAAGWITTGILLAAAIAVTFIYMATPYYRAQMLISPANPLLGGAEMAPLAGNDNFSALRYLVQRGVVSGSADFLRFENTIGGASAAAKLLADEKIKRGLALDAAFSNSEAKTDWTPEELAEYIDKRVKIEPVGASALRRVSYLHPSREFGIYMLHRLHRLADDAIRASVREEAEARIAYLQQQSDKTVNPDHRRALTGLLMEQERLLMLASIDQPYAASIIEPPSASSKPYWPDALMIVPVLMFAGALLGFALHGFFRGRPEEDIPLTVSRPAWYKSEGSNANERKLKERKAAE
jgi:uncharacterized protein involved in exopolysaccharide biosynthesis